MVPRPFLSHDRSRPCVGAYARPMEVTTPDRRPRWPLVAALAGAGAGSIAALSLACAYYLRFPDIGAGWSWSMWAASIAVMAPTCTAVWGVVCCGGLAIGRRRGRPLLGAAIGGAIGSLLPSLVATVGYGSLHAPYPGTGPIAFSVLLGIYLFASLGSLPAATGRRSELSRGRTLLASALASLAVAMPFGLVCATLITHVFPEPVVRSVVATLGDSPCDDSLAVLASMGVLVSGTAGAALGVYLGLTTRLATIIRRAMPTAA